MASWIPALGWFAFSHWLLASSSPPALFGPRLPFVGNAGHAVLGGGVAFFTLLALPGSGVRGRSAFLVAWGITWLWAGGEEWVQAYVPGRSPCGFDVLTGGLGGALALAAIWGWTTLGRLSWREASLALLAMTSALAATLLD